MKIHYPFDPSLKHHAIIAFGLAVWVFAFLYFTEPMDVNEFADREKLIYLPIYGLIAGVCYLCFMPLQNLLYKKSDERWRLSHEIVFIFSFSLVASVFARLFYLYVIVAGQPNPYTLRFHIQGIILPALSVILPILIIGRFAFGKYKEKQLEDQKVEIKGEGNYDSLKLQFNDIIGIQSSDNYVEVWHRSGNVFKKTLIRTKLSGLEEQFPGLLRTHRSYLVNPFHFETFKTEKGKLVLQLSNDFIVPVSKTYQKEVKRSMGAE